MKSLALILVIVGLAAAQSSTAAPQKYSPEQIRALEQFSRRIQSEKTIATNSKDRPVDLPVGPCKSLCIVYCHVLSQAYVRVLNPLAGHWTLSTGHKHKIY